MTWESIENIINSDKEAYSQLYIEYFKKFYNYGKKFTTNTSIIEDSIQEVFLDFYLKKEKLQKVESVSSYFFSAFRFCLIRNIKSAKKILLAEEFETTPEFAVDQIIIKRELDLELKIKLDTALKTLTPHQREAIFLRFYEGLSYEEVAAILNITVKATYKIMARSLSALKDSMFIPIGALLLILKSENFY